MAKTPTTKRRGAEKPQDQAAATGSEKLKETGTAPTPETTDAAEDTGDNLTDDQRGRLKEGNSATTAKALQEIAPPKKDTVEESIQRLGLTAPRVTDSDIEANIADEQYYVFPDSTVTVCMLRLRNNFTVIGHSACASKDNFNAKLGQRIARDDAKRQVWALMGYELRTSLKGLKPFGSPDWAN